MLSDPVLLAQSEHHSGEDVVRAHHQRNGIPRAPAPERLRAVRAQQQPTSGIVSTSTSAAQGAQPLSEPPPTVTTDVDDGKLTGHPTKLRSYPHKFREVIERAKLIAQCDSATKDPFPSRSTFLDIVSVEIINEALHECINIPQGKIISSRLRCTYKFVGYWPNYRSQLGILVGIAYTLCSVLTRIVAMGVIDDMALDYQSKGP